MTCIREKVTLATAGYLLNPNAERHLKSPAEMARLFARWPHAIAATREFADASTSASTNCATNIRARRVPDGRDAAAVSRASDLGRRAAGAGREGCRTRSMTQLQPRADADREARLRALFPDRPRHRRLRAQPRSADPVPGARRRRRTARSATASGSPRSIRPTSDLLFERFISEERKEPPDIDVDFEHERREEVIQHIYQKYGRDRAGIARDGDPLPPAHRRSARSARRWACREDVTAAIASTHWGSWRPRSSRTARVDEAGLDLTDPHLRRTIEARRADDRHAAPSVAACRRLHPDRAAADRDGADRQWRDGRPHLHRMGQGRHRRARHPQDRRARARHADLHPQRRST